MSALSHCLIAQSNARHHQHHTHQTQHSALVVLPVLVALLIFALEPAGTLATRNNSVRRSAAPVQPKSMAEWEELFSLRSEDDWRQAWHEEKHRRCNHQLLAHMELVCDKDVYKMQRKRKKRSAHNTPSEQQNRLLLSARKANLFGRRLMKRFEMVPEAAAASRAKRGITEECCQGADGCSWEEYAEYCPANVRVRNGNSL